MKIPFAQIEIGERFWFAGETHEKDGPDHSVQVRGPHRGPGWYISHDSEFPEFELCLDRDDTSCEELHDQIKENLRRCGLRYKVQK